MARRPGRTSRAVSDVSSNAHKDCVPRDAEHGGRDARAARLGILDQLNVAEVRRLFFYQKKDRLRTSPINDQMPSPHTRPRMENVRLKVLKSMIP
jgi:hypothetical protein